jgi:hypothetical protein
MSIIESKRILKMIQTGEIKNLLATITEINLNNHIKLTAALKKTTLIDKLK